MEKYYIFAYILRSHLFSHPSAGYEKDGTTYNVHKVPVLFHPMEKYWDFTYILWSHLFPIFLVDVKKDMSIQCTQNVYFSIRWKSTLTLCTLYANIFMLTSFFYLSDRCEKDVYNLRKNAVLFHQMGKYCDFAYIVL